MFASPFGGWGGGGGWGGSPYEVDPRYARALQAERQRQALERQRQAAERQRRAEAAELARRRAAYEAEMERRQQIAAAQQEQQRRRELAMRQRAAAAEQQAMNEGIAYDMFGRPYRIHPRRQQQQPPVSVVPVAHAKRDDEMSEDGDSEGPAVSPLLSDETPSMPTRVSPGQQRRTSPRASPRSSPQTARTTLRIPVQEARVMTEEEREAQRIKEMERRAAAERAAAEERAAREAAAAAAAERKLAEAVEKMRSGIAAKRIQRWWRAHLDAKYNPPADPRIEVVDESFRIPPWRVLPDTVDNVILEAPISAH